MDRARRYIKGGRVDIVPSIVKDRGTRIQIYPSICFEYCKLQKVKLKATACEFVVGIGSDG